MNQLIERFIAESTICQGHPQIDGSYFDKEKFAKLIVRECVEVANKTVIGSDFVGNAIRNHFGVEE